MMYNLKVKSREFLCILLSVCFCSTLVAADGEEVNVQVTFSCVSWDKPIRKTLYVDSEGEMVPFRVHTKRRSASIDYRGPNPIVFFSKSAGVEGGEYREIAQVSLADGIDEPLFFFVSNGASYKIITIEDSFDSYPSGSYRFYNFTDRELFAKMGESKLQLPPRETVYLEKPFSGTMEYPIVFVVRNPEGIRPLYTNMWTHIERFRYLIFVSDSETRDTGAVNFRILSDYEHAK